MISGIRDEFNLNFDESSYHALLTDLTMYGGKEIPFRIAETPVFISSSFKEKLLYAGSEIISQLDSEEYRQISSMAVPPQFKVPGDVGHPVFLALDFAVVMTDKGVYEPRLIELQGFPSLFMYQHLLALHYKKHFVIPDNFSHLLSDRDDDYVEDFRKALLGKCDPKEVILLECDPASQNTYIDFAATEKNTGVQPVCISRVFAEDRKLYYYYQKKKQHIKRIYNRVIFDELVARKDLVRGFNLTDDVEVEWVCHPDWFYRISKFALPYLKSRFVPYSFFADQVSDFPLDYQNYIMKPLYSFSGSGVKLDITAADIQGLQEPKNWLLQRRVDYAPVIKTPHENAKCEIRIMYMCKAGSNRPKPVISLARLSKGAMTGVKYNRDKAWVGSSVCFFER